MTKSQLRRILERYSHFGVLFVAAYLGCRHLWTKYRTAVGTTLATVTVTLSFVLIAFLRYSSPPAVGALETIAPIEQPKVKAEPAEPEPQLDYRPTNRLLDIAKPVLHVPDNYTTHFWLSDTRLLLVTKETQQQEDDEFPSPSDWRGKAELIDIRSGRRTLLRGLTRVLNKCEGEPYNFEWSPRRRWLKWMCYRTPDQWPFPVAARLNGTGFYELIQDKFSDTFWLDDNHWVELAHVSKVLYVKNLARQTVRQFPLNSRTAQKILRRRSKSALEEAAEVTLSHQFPKGTKISFKKATLTGQRIAYSVVSAQEKHSTFAALWVSKQDGSQLRELGYLPFEYTSDWYRMAIAELAHLEQTLEWLPSGKKCAFVYREVLYTVQASR